MRKAFLRTLLVEFMIGTQALIAALGLVISLWTARSLPAGTLSESVHSNPSAPGVQRTPGPPSEAFAMRNEEDARESARRELDALYKGDYRQAFVKKKPELFLKHIAPNFHSTLIDGSTYDTKALQQLFPRQFADMVQTHEHNVAIEGVDVAPNGTIDAVVTLSTLIEYKSAQGQKYFVMTIATYHDSFVRALNGVLLEISGDQLRSQTITWRKP